MLVQPVENHQLLYIPNCPLVWPQLLLHVRDVGNYCGLYQQPQLTPKPASAVRKIFLSVPAALVMTRLGPI